MALQRAKDRATPRLSYDAQHGDLFAKHVALMSPADDRSPVNEDSTVPDCSSVPFDETVEAFRKMGGFLECPTSAIRLLGLMAVDVIDAVYCGLRPSVNE